MDLEIYKIIRASEEDSGIKLTSNIENSIHWDQSHCVFVEQYCEVMDLKKFVEENQDQIEKLGILKVYIDTESSRKIIEETFKDWSLYLYKRDTYRGNTSIVLENDKNCKDVKSMVVNGQQFMNFETLKDEILSTWGDLDTFMQYGFGVCNVDNNCIRGWCLSEYNSPGKCGIGIETVEKYQRKGIALGMTNSFLTKCRDRDIIPYWDSWDWNKGSIKTAEKCGFSIVQEYQTYLIKS